MIFEMKNYLSEVLSLLLLFPSTGNRQLKQSLVWLIIFKTLRRAAKSLLNLSHCVIKMWIS